ncbi:hypothetical protein BDF14DRAFT_1809634 [Spinellus fusiger]|nr:hypothetical protein BDF14DRAFT_1809634 [Spinellus fusiger]
MTLVDYEWDLQRALQNIYENSSSTESNTNTNTSTNTTNTNTTTTPLESLPQGTTNSPRSRHSHTTRPTPPRSLGLLTFLTWPFGIAWNITWAVLAFASQFLGRLSITQRPPSVVQDPSVAAREFVEAFEAEHGTTHPVFYQGGYSQALETARRELRFLWVVVLCKEHDATSSFCRNTLASESLVSFLAVNNILVWGGDVRFAEASRVSTTLQATTYPFSAIIALQPTRGSSAPAMIVIERFHGNTLASDIITAWERVLQRHSGSMGRLQTERDQRDVERRLRQEQDQAYRDSLLADQEKARKVREEKEAETKAKEEAQQREALRLETVQKRKQYIRYLCNALEQEPGAEYQGKVAKLSFRLADGRRVLRRFKVEASVETLYQFVEAYSFIEEEATSEGMANTLPTNYVHKYNFTITSPYPRKVYDAKSDQMLLDDKSLYPSANLIVDAEEEE